MIELGALICLPNRPPLCDACPVRALCRAHERGLAETLPVRGKKPARKIDPRTVLLVRSGTRREELLLTPQELEGAYSARRMLSGGNSQQNSELLLSLIEKTADNADFLSRIKGWLSVYEKEGYSTGR